MSIESEQNARTSGLVLVAASLAAGVIGGAMALAQASRRKSRSSDPKAVVRPEVDQTAKQLNESASRLMEVSREQAPILAKSIGDQAAVKLSTFLDQTEGLRRDAVQSLEKRGVDVTAASEHAREAVGQVAKGIKAGDLNLDTFSQSGRELGQRLRERLPEAQDAVHEQLAPRIADFRRQADSTIAGANELRLTHAADIAPRLKDLGKQASRMAAGAAETSREHAPELKALLEDHVVPRLQDARQRATSLAGDAFEAGVERSNQASGGGMPDLRHSADDLQKRFAESLGAAERSISDIRGNASHAVDTVGAQARVVGKNAGDGSKNAGAAILWSGVAVAVVYAGLLKPEQREVVKQKATVAFQRAKNTYADIRGRDGDFASDLKDSK